jgi:succinyl-diaminopimelate desuccinylase
MVEHSHGRAMNDISELAKQLISRPSITPNDAGCQTIISERLGPLGFTSEHLRFGEVDNLWARIGKKSPLLVFAGHTDVVPTGPESDWTQAPFLPEIRDNFLYGRGASDMKGALASMIIATERFIKATPNFEGSIAFLITSDEEGPSIDGTQKVIEWLEARDEKIDYCIIGEPSSKDQIGDQIRIGRRGSLHGKLTVLGKQGHVAHPHLAINPIHMSMSPLYELTQTEWDKGNDEFPPTTFQITNIHSGTGAMNVIPGALEVLFNFRFGTAVSVSQLKERTIDILNNHQIKHKLEWKIGAHPFLSKQGKLIQITEESIEVITGRKTKRSTGGGTSDGRFIAKTGAEIVELGVLHATAHHIDECVNVNDLVILTDIYEHMLHSIFI